MRYTGKYQSQRPQKPGWLIGRIDWALPTQRGAGFVFELQLTGSRGTAELSLSGGGLLTPTGAVLVHGEEQLASILLEAQIEPAHCLASLRGQLRRAALLRASQSQHAASHAGMDVASWPQARAS